jgi:hypothetical protein
MAAGPDHSRCRSRARPHDISAAVKFHTPALNPDAAISQIQKPKNYRDAMRNTPGVDWNIPFFRDDRHRKAT